MANKIILASKSPRRKELLESLGIQFQISVSDSEESVNSSFPFEKQIQLIALEKALSVHKKFPEDIIIAGDTLVVLDNQLLGKPKSNQVAYDMLNSLSNQTHRVISGVCVIFDDEIMSYSEESKVKLKDVSDDIINQYIELCKPFDKAGSYGIQDAFFKEHFLESIEGEYENIKGLPLVRLREILKARNLI